MQLPLGNGLFGAAALAGLAIFVCGRVLHSAISAMGNPALDKKARIYVGCFALAGVLILLGTSLAAAKLADHGQDQGFSQPSHGSVTRD